MLAHEVNRAGSQKDFAKQRGVSVRAVGMALDRERDVTPSLIAAMGFVIVPTIRPVNRAARALCRKVPS